MDDDSSLPKPERSTGEQPQADPDRQVEPVDAEQPPRLPFPVVGIGASAGGLEAVGEFLAAMRPDGGMAFVLVQHLPPDRESLMAEILSRRTAMTVVEIEDGIEVQPNHLYVIRPGRRLTIQDGRLHLGPPLHSSRAANRPIDDFFKSLAEEQRERAICVVMSGMGSNGAAGAQAVKAVGGLCIAQDPESAQFPSMPRHLIDAGYADYILRPADLPEMLLAYAEHPYARGVRQTDPEATLDHEQQHLREILAVLRTRTNKDFSGYKKPTLLRRVERRMGLAQLTTIGEYARLMRQSPGEVTALADDLLIHVTGFFRDPEAWEALRWSVIAPLAEAREPGGSVRAWVTACSSGEEAYSLAMLLVEESDRVRAALDIKVFATDLADRTLAQARAGLYPGGIESEITPERLSRFFVKEDEVYRVRPELRDRVVFAPQNLLQDPPFSRLDIAACRNLLIYLEPEVQQRVLGMLHFGLREGGTLFLGSSETVAGSEELFEPIDKRARIFRRIGPTRHGWLDFPMPHSLTLTNVTVGHPRVASVPVRVRATRAEARTSLADQTRRTLLEGHTPPAVTVDRDGRISFYHGDTRPFLQQLTGEPTRDLMLLAREGVRGVVRAALHRSLASGERATASDGWADLESGRRVRVAVTASPLLSDEPPVEGAGPGYTVVSFDQWGEVVPAISSLATESADEFRRLNAELQGTIEELQTSNEELKAAHEEVVSINEEYQSTNEELETSKEEMQSLNEELTTVNAQLRSKMEELQSTSGDLASLLASTDIAVLFLDTDLRIRRYTAAMRNLVDLITSDVGRPLAALAMRFDDPHLNDDARTVLERLVPIEREVAAGGDRLYLRRVLPYRTVDNRIDGVVVTFVDITDRVRAESSAHASDELFRLLIENVRDYAIFFVDPDGQVAGWWEGAERLLGYRKEEVLGTNAERFFDAEDRAADAFAHELQSAAENGRATEEGWLIRKNGSRFWGNGVVTALRDSDGGLKGFVKIVRDHTESRAAEAAVREARDRLRLALVAARMGIWMWDVEADAHIRDANLNRLLGLEAIETRQPFAEFLMHVHPDDRELVSSAFDGAVQRGRPLNVEFRIIWPDGSVHWLRNQGDVFDASAGQLPQLTGACVDMTNLKAAEEALRRSRDQLEERVAERTDELARANEALRESLSARTELLRRLVTAQEDERRRMARDLHDGMGQELTALILGLGALDRALPEQSIVRERLREVEASVAQIGREVHDLALNLSPTALDDLGLVPALSAYIPRWSERTGVTAEFQLLGGHDNRFASEIETTVYRVVQEALNNVAKHAGGQRVSVILEQRDREIIVLVEDDGQGFDPKQLGFSTRTGLGLLGMSERVSLVSGELIVESAPGEGTTVRARIPFEPTAKEAGDG